MDQLILGEAQRKLTARSNMFARTVTCQCEDGVLILSGKVPTFYLKQTAQSLVQGIEGIERVENDLVVSNPAGVSSEPAGVS